MKNFAQTFRKIILLFGCLLFGLADGLCQQQQKFAKKDVHPNPALLPYMEKCQMLYSAENYDSLLILARQGMSLAEKYKDSLAIGRMYHYLGLYARSVRDYPGQRRPR